MCRLTYEKTEDALNDASSAITQILSPFKMEKDICALIDIGALTQGISTSRSYESLFDVYEKEPSGD